MDRIVARDAKPASLYNEEVLWPRACAAAISGKPEHGYQTGAPRRWLQQADAAFGMLPALEKRLRAEAE